MLQGNRVLVPSLTCVLLPPPIRGSAEDAFRWDLRLRCPLLAARSDREFCCEKAHGAGARSFRNSYKSGISGKAPKIRSAKYFS